RVMGERFANSGPLTLTANYASAAGRTVATVQIFEGVPGRNGTVTQLSSTAVTTITPAAGNHFYYAKVTQDDGKILWSAPVWVTQGTGGGDTTPPSVTASTSGTSGTITLSATASDNVGVTNVEFLVDGVLKGSDASSPYSIALDSTALANGSHTLVAKAYDAAGNSTASTGVAFTVSNTSGTTFIETESNGTVAAANTVARTYTAIRGTMGTTTDKDYFKLTLNANETLRVDMSGGPSGSDYDLYLVNASDATLKSSTGGTSTETLSYTNGASAQTVYAKVIAYSGSSTTAQYDLALTYTAGSGGATQHVLNPSFESGASSWTATSGVVTSDSGQAARTGTWKAWLNGYGSAHTDTLYQQVAIPAGATSATLSFWLRIDSAETTTTQAYDTLKVQLRNTSGAVLTTLATYSNLHKGTSYVQRSFNVAAWKGQTVRVHFEGIEGSTVATSFVIDDVALTTQ
ncbi:MAG TPA: Ig-like domain-containing protein, partial [Xanthomonadales bacterium]|nr:Ig-like domain-containing protein [Xanthomonadales bacterium]